jgi:hypothetical protein
MFALFKKKKFAQGFTLFQMFRPELWRGGAWGAVKYLFLWAISATNSSQLQPPFSLAHSGLSPQRRFLRQLLNLIY